MNSNDSSQRGYNDGSPLPETIPSTPSAAYTSLHLAMGFLFGTLFWIFFPGRTCPDSASHIQQAVERVFNAHHARFTSYLMSWLPNYEFLPNYSFFFLLNIVLSLAFIPFVVRVTLPTKIPALIGFAITALLSLGAAVVLAPLTITVWKDALLNSLLIASAIIATYLLTTTHCKTRTKVSLALVGALLAFAVMNVRPNGYLAIIPFMAVYFLQGLPRIKKPLVRYTLLAVWSLGVPVASVYVARIVMPATPADQEEHIMNNDLIGMKTLGANLLPDPSAPEAIVFLAQGIMNQTWTGAGGNCWEYQMPRSLAHIKELWLSTIMRNPMLYLQVRATCFRNLLIPPPGRPPIAYSRSAFNSSPFIKEFFVESPIRDQTIALFDSLYMKFAYGATVLKANLALLLASLILFYFSRDRVIGAAAVISLSSAIFFAGYFFIITTGDFRFISWVLSAVVLSILLTVVFMTRQLCNAVLWLRTRHLR